MSRVIVIALIASLSLAACNKAPAPPAPPAAPAVPAAPPPPAPGAQAAVAEAKRGSELSVIGVDLGTEVKADDRVVTALESFAPTDTIIASVALANAGSAPADGSIGARWTGPDGQVFNDESQARAWPAGPQAVVFRVAEPKGFAPGNYKVEVSLNGSVVQMREFAVK
jgi:hypothetical protein